MGAHKELTHRGMRHWLREAVRQCADPGGFQRAVWMLAAVALALRVAAILVVNDWHAPHDWEYGVIARNLLAGEGFSGSAWFVPEGPTAFMAPLYVFFLAAGYGMLGEHAYLPLQVFQALVGALSVVLLADCARRVFGPVTGLCAGLVLALNPTHAYLASQMHPLVLLAALLLAAIWCALRLGERPSAGRAAALGGCIGISMLTDPAIAVFAPVLGLYPVIVHWAQWKRGFALAAIATATACAVVAPWTIRNYIVFERFILVKSQAGFILWVGNHDGATGTQTLLGPDGQAMNASHRLDPDTRQRLHELGEPEAYREFGRMAKAHMRENPGETAARSLRKAAYFWWFPTWLTDPHDAQHPLTGQLRHPYKYVWAVVLVLAVAGLLHRRREWRRWAILAAAMVCYTLLYAATNVGSNPRYRIPVEPVVMAFSGAAVARMAAHGRVGLDDEAADQHGDNI
jgi:4-amino-4-deoxy-L-arabinose transferase-like glycosyltransferase